MFMAGTDGNADAWTAVDPTHYSSKISGTVNAGEGRDRVTLDIPAGFTLTAALGITKIGTTNLNEGSFLFEKAQDNEDTDAVDPVTPKPDKGDFDGSDIRISITNYRGNDDAAGPKSISVTVEQAAYTTIYDIHDAEQLDIAGELINIPELLGEIQAANIMDSGTSASSNLGELGLEEIKIADKTAVDADTSVLKMTSVDSNQNNLFIGLNSDTVTDQISGGGGADTILALGGTNVVDGGLGVDTMSFAHDTRGVDLNMFSTGAQSTGEDTQTVRNVENIVGSDHADVIGGSGRDNILAGMDGDDTLSGGYGDDVLIGGLGNDTLDGGLGNDILISMGGGDTMTGGSGSDTFIIDIQSVMNFMTDELNNLNYPMHFDGYHTIEDFNTRSDSLVVVESLGAFADLTPHGLSGITFAGDATTGLATRLSYDSSDGMLSLNITSVKDGAGNDMGLTNTIELAQLSRGMDEQDVLGSITGHTELNASTVTTLGFDLDILAASEILDAGSNV